MSTVKEISEMLQQCKVKDVVRLVDQAIQEGLSADEIINDGLLAGMDVVSEKFKNGDMFVPEVLVAAKAMNEGMQRLKPILSDGDIRTVGKVAIGTVKGDLHNVGKDFVKLLMESKGLEVTDLGEDVDPDVFVNMVKDDKCDILAMSAMLTSTMPVMKEVVDILKAEGLQDKVKIMIGGAPVNKEFADEIDAVYTNDATEATEVALSFFA